MQRRNFMLASCSAPILIACGGGGSDPWEEFGNAEWEGYPFAGRTLPPVPGPLAPETAVENDIAFFPEETVSPNYQPPGLMASKGLTHVVGMLNAATVYNHDRGFTALIELRWVRLIRRDPLTGVETVAEDIRIGRNQAGALGRLEWDTFNREPDWFRSEIAAKKIIPAFTDIAAFINLRDNPKGIYHAWTAPRHLVVPGQLYFVEVLARITGDARLQLGMDYWRGPSARYNWYSSTCLDSNNCQAYLGDWHGDTGGFFRTIRAPLRF